MQTLISRRSILLQLAALVLTAVVFGIWPQIDVDVARLFVRDDGLFVGVSVTGHVLRNILYALPLVLGGGLLLIWLAARWHMPKWPVPSNRAIAFMLISLALGPGLLVNGVLKEVSHRPRPFHVTQVQGLGGKWDFRPWYRFDGQCESNCSFVSGEASAAMWTLAPALVAPLPVRALAIGASILVTVATGLWRMALGGHFLSDVLMGALLTSLTVCLLYLAMFRHSGPGRPDLHEVVKASYKDKLYR
ncbi:phosphatase PAP2 family protein [Roseiarcaceae bacterium H3SJ34-1]|uniref:phosphatase PAP2 family protein n=1 Tax=Terripilifer ovatus TaxID=3032367 RepID=UPI003AB9B926|nr:phosphatase PAP2 family protein [Roseiarcaceae bacterium H3SJ34-1]